MRTLFRHRVARARKHDGRSLHAIAHLALLCTLTSSCADLVHAQPPPDQVQGEQDSPARHLCLPSGDGYLRARLDGALKVELDWGNDGTHCTGAVRPTDSGIRLSFTSSLESGDTLVLVFGIASLREGQSAHSVPVNVTVIREGNGEFYGTQGDDKCMLDEVHQKPLVGIPNRTRTYRVEARGFCTQPARAIGGEGAVMISRFDFAGRVDFDAEDSETDSEPIQVAER